MTQKHDEGRPQRKVGSEMSQQEDKALGKDINL